MTILVLLVGAELIGPLACWWLLTNGPHQPKMSFQTFCKNAWGDGVVPRVLMLSPFSVVTAVGMIMYGPGDMPAAR